MSQSWRLPRRIEIYEMRREGEGPSLRCLVCTVEWEGVIYFYLRSGGCCYWGLFVHIWEETRMEQFGDGDGDDLHLLPLFVFWRHYWRLGVKTNACLG